MSEKYQGWTNFETWCVALWLDNDEKLNKWIYWKAPKFLKRQIKEIEKLSDRKNSFTSAEIDFADLIKKYIEAKQPRAVKQSGLYGDLMSGALRAVNYREIAKHILEF